MKELIFRGISQNTVLMRHLCLFALAPPLIVFAQNDTLLFLNNNLIVGELKSMEKGVMTIETDYSDSDLKLEWSEVHEIYTETYYFISLAKGINFNGRIKSTSAGNVRIITEEDSVIYIDKTRIVYMTAVEQNFWDRVSASIDIGFNFAKAKSLRQLNTRSTLGYNARKWLINATFNTLISTQDDADKTERTEGIIDHRYLLFINWYSIATVSLLSNTEQKLDLRLIAQLGWGRFLLQSNVAYWGIGIGVNRNIEQYSNETADRQTWETYFSSELNLFDVADLNLILSGIAYMGLTESGRWRADLNFDFKYDLPFDLYIRLGVSYNFDNRPAEGASRHDYILQNGIGWEW